MLKLLLILKRKIYKLDTNAYFFVVIPITYVSLVFFIVS